MLAALSHDGGSDLILMITPTDLAAQASMDIAGSMNALLDETERRTWFLFESSRRID
jgi:hypothetical protein